MNFRHAGCCAAVVSLALAASAAADTNVVVSPAGLGPWQSVVSDTHGNFVTNTDATVSWGVNPPGAPLGTGSVTLDTGTNHGDSAPQLVDQALAGTQLAALKTLSYSTLGTLIAGPNLQGQLPYLVLTLDTNGDGVEDDSIVFEPLYQHGYRSGHPRPGGDRRPASGSAGTRCRRLVVVQRHPGRREPGLRREDDPGDPRGGAGRARSCRRTRSRRAALRVVIGVRNVPDHLVGSVDALSIDTGTGVTTLRLRARHARRRRTAASCCSRSPATSSSAARR